MSRVCEGLEGLALCGRWILAAGALGCAALDGGTRVDCMLSLWGVYSFEVTKIEVWGPRIPIMAPCFDDVELRLGVRSSCGDARGLTRVLVSEW